MEYSMPTSVALTPHFETLTQQLVSNGRYNNVSEVVRDGLRLLESRMQEESVKLAALRDATQHGFDAIERGDFVELATTQDIAATVRQAGQRAAARHKKSA
jgi:antitoxin ParD1/3/4